MVDGRDERAGGAVDPDAEREIGGDGVASTKDATGPRHLSRRTAELKGPAGITTPIRSLRDIRRGTREPRTADKVELSRL